MGRLLTMLAATTGIILLAGFGGADRSQTNAVKQQYSHYKAKIEGGIRLGLNARKETSELDKFLGKPPRLVSNGFDPEDSCIELRIVNKSEHAITSCEIGFSLFGNGQKIYESGTLGILGQPRFDQRVASGSEETVYHHVEKGSDAYFKLKSAGEMELKFSYSDLIIAEIDGKDINFKKWTVSDPLHQLNDRAWKFATLADPSGRDGTKAVEYAKKACDQTDWKNPFYLDTLAAAYAEAGDFEQAVRYQRQAVEHPSAKLLMREDFSAAKQRLEQYQRREPYRQGKRS